MTKKTLKDKLHDGKSVIGTWSTIPSPSVVEVIAQAGFDFIIIDMEHGPMSFETAENMVRAAETKGCTPLVRVSANLDWQILRALEIGAHGVVVPQVTSPKEAERAIKAIKYYPRGERGFSPFTRAGGYTNQDTNKLAAKANKKTLSVLLVEGIQGIAELDSILKVPDIDVIYLGTYDLSQSAGHPGQPNHPDVLAYIKSCVGKIKKHSVAPGILIQDQVELKRAQDLGIQFLAYLADCAILYKTCADIKLLLT